MTSLNEVNIETGKVEVEVFNKTEAALAELRERYGVVPSLDTEEGYNFVKDGLKELVSLRTSLDAERKRIKQPYLDAGRIIDAEAKRITEALVELETPMKDAKKEFDDREKRMKEERLARLRTKIEGIRSWVVRARNQQSATIAEMIEEVDSIDTAEDFFELSKEAAEAKNETLERLNEMYTERLAFERSEQERKQAEEARKAMELQQQIGDRINKLRMIPMDLMGKKAAEILAKIASLRNYEPPAAEFGDRHQEALDAHKQVITQLETMAAQAEMVEQAEAKKAEEEAAKQAAEQEAAAEQAAKAEAERKEKFPGVDIDAIHHKQEAKAKEVAPQQEEPEQDREVTIKVVCDSSNSSAILSLLMDQYAVDIVGDEFTGFVVTVK